jgi:hypothetical protein
MRKSGKVVKNGDYPQIILTKRVLAQAESAVIRCSSFAKPAGVFEHNA